MDWNIKEILENNSFYKEALSLIKCNSIGKIYLTGSFVFKTIIKETAESNKEIDFLCDELVSDLFLPNEWNVKINKFGHPSFVKEDYKIDPIQLTKHINIVRKNLPPTLDSYLISVPLNIQSIAYDIEENKIIGNIGIKAIQDKVIKFNNKDHAEYSCQNFHKYSVEDMIIKMANSIGFKYELH